MSISRAQGHDRTEGIPAPGRYKDLILRPPSGYLLKAQKPSSSVPTAAGGPDSLRAHAGRPAGRPEGGLGTARMKTRVLTVLLAAGVLLVAGLTAFSIPAEAQSQTVTVRLPDGQVVEVTVDVPAGGSLSDIKLPGTIVEKPATAQAPAAPAPTPTETTTTPAPPPTPAPPTAGGGSPQGRTGSGELV